MAPNLRANRHAYSSRFASTSTCKAWICAYSVVRWPSRQLRPILPCQDLASASAAQSSERELLCRLRQIRASGRVVLEFKPSSSGIAEIPKLALEDGDRLIIPSVPGTVNVVGAVNNQNSFLYSNTNRDMVGTYLKKAGGLTRDADRKRAFVIRASGEVVGYDSTRSAWRSDFDSLRIYPGDTIVVPREDISPIGFARGDGVVSDVLAIRNWRRLDRRDSLKT